MKEFKSVTVKNFFSYGQDEQTLKLDGSGIVNINGVNGKGKTTICVEALTFAIFGKHREDKIDDCVNRDVGKNCKVSLEFIGDDNQVYKIIRYRKHDTHGNSVYIFKGDKDISCKNSKDTDQQIQDLVGMPYIAFTNSTLFSSELYSNFLSSKNSERLVIFENILSLKEVSIFYTLAKGVLKEISEKEELARINLTEATTKSKTISDSIDSYSNQAKAKLLELKKEREEITEVIKKTEEAIKTLKELDVDKEKAKLSNNTLKEEYEKQISEKEKLISELFDFEKPSSLLLELVDRYKDFDFEENKRKEEKAKKLQEEINEKKDEVLNLENGLKELKSELLLLNNKEGSLKEKESSLEKEVKNLEKEIDKEEKNLEKIKESICPYCGQKMDEEETNKKRQEVLSKKETFEKEKEEALKKKEKVAAEIKELSKEKDEFDNKYSKTEAFFKEKTNALKEVKETLEKIEYVNNTDLVKEKVSNAKKVLEEYEKNKLQASEKEKTYKEEIEKNKGKSSSLEISSYTLEELEDISKQISEKEKLVEESNIRISAINGSVSSVYDKGYIEKQKEILKEAEEVSEKMKKELEAVEEERKYYECLVECFSNKSNGFKKFFIHEMIPLFNENVAKFLPFFFADKKVEISFDKDLNDEIKVDGVKVSFSSFSRGQKTRAELTIAFALFGLSRVFFSNKSGLLVLDELLDNGLDEVGIKSAISLLESFAEEAKVFVVSHNNAVKDCINEVIEIRTDENNFSYIKK